MSLSQAFRDLAGKGSVIVLCNGLEAPAAVYVDVFDAASSFMPTLRFDLVYKAEHICGPNYWLALSPSMAKQAGKCLRDMVKRELLPLEVVPSRGPMLRYRRR